MPCSFAARLGLVVLGLTLSPATSASQPLLVGPLLPSVPPGGPVLFEDPFPIMGFLSPPEVGRPYYICSNVIHVGGAVPQAEVELTGEIDGQPIQLRGTASWFGEVSFRLPRPIATEQDWFVAVQDDGTDRSLPDADPSDPRIRALFPPDPAPSPSVYWSPHYRCGVRAGITNFLRGATVTLVGHSPLGSMPLFTAHEVAFHAAEGESRGYFQEEQLEARSEFCRSGPLARFAVSSRVVVQPYPRESIPGQPGQWRPKAPPPPTIEVPEGLPFVLLGNLWHGATLEVLDAAGQVVGKGATASPTAHVFLGFVPSPTAQFQGRQSFPGCHSGTVGNLTPVTPCRALPPPAIQRPAPDDDHVTVLRRSPGAVVSVFALAARGDRPQNPPLARGTATRLRLRRPLLPLEHLLVVQAIGNCTSERAYGIQVDCGADRQGELLHLELLSHRRRRTDGQTLTVPGCR